MSQTSIQTEPRVGCGAAIVRNGQLLLVQRLRPPEAGAWGLPGGKIDLYETAEAAVRREIHEEIGVRIKKAELLCVMDQIDPKAGVHWVAPIYRVDEFAGEPSNLEPHKHGGVRWFDLNSLPESLTTPTRVAVARLSAR